MHSLLPSLRVWETDANWLGSRVSVCVFVSLGKKKQVILWRNIPLSDLFQMLTMQIQQMKTTFSVVFGICHILAHLYASLSLCQHEILNKLNTNMHTHHLVAFGNPQWRHWLATWRLLFVSLLMNVTVLRSDTGLLVKTWINFLFLWCLCVCQSNAESGGWGYIGRGSGFCNLHELKFAQHVPNTFHLNPNSIQFLHNVAITHLIIELARLERTMMRTPVSCLIL